MYKLFITQNYGKYQKYYKDIEILNIVTVGKTVVIIFFNNETNDIEKLCLSLIEDTFNVES